MANAQEINEFFNREFPHNQLVIEFVGKREARVRSSISKGDLRPGNTVSGPFMMSMADTALYVAILGELGLVALAVTSNLNINFFKRPSPNADVRADCKLLKIGKKLVVGEVFLYSVGDSEPIAHAVGTYSIPPLRSTAVA